MKSTFIANLSSGMNLENEPFLLQDVTRRKTKNGSAYLLCTLRDNSGQIGGVFWDVPDYIDAWARPGIIVLVTGKANTYKETLQVNLTDLNPGGNISMSYFLPNSKRPREEMLDELRSWIAVLKEPWQGLVVNILLNNDFLTQFADAPAARGMHHAYIGGLLEHTLSMVKVANMLADHYGYVNKDLLLAGTLLHDMGKTVEYSMEGEFGFSEDGRLIGHIVRAIVMVETAAAKISFPEDELRQLIHLIASHHGKLEWGSPVVPKTIEALLLHQVDLLDSRVQGFLDHIDSDAGEGVWTTKSSTMFGTALRHPTSSNS